MRGGEGEHVREGEGIREKEGGEEYRERRGRGGGDHYFIPISCISPLFFSISILCSVPLTHIHLAAKFRGRNQKLIISQGYRFLFNRVSFICHFTHVSLENL